jgi:parallel beta-helix repeat protein
VKNGKIRQMNSAVYLYLDSDNNTITNLTLENNTIGVLVRNASSGNMITDIIITNINTTINYYGVYLLSSSTSNVVMRVKESRSKTGILIENSQNNIIKDNILDSNDLAGIHITDSANGNIIEGNTLNSSYMAIEIYSGIYNIISKNSLNNNNKSLYLYGQRDRDFNNMITIDNIVGSSHRIYYNYSISNYVFDSTNSGDADEVVCIKCDNVVIKDLDLSTTGAEGVYLYNTTNSVIKNVSIRNKEIGVYTKFGYNNNMTNNKACGNLVRDFYCDSSTGNFGTGNNFTLVTSVSCSGWPVSGVDYSPCGGGATCNDSDGGIDYYVRGTVYDRREEERNGRRKRKE